MRYGHEFFEEIPANAKSIANRKPIFGVGMNDAGFITKARCDDGIRRVHPGYAAWTRVLERSLCKKYKAIRPTYAEVAICEEWKVFSVFNDWWKSNHVDGWHLDKDLLRPGNKIYGPDTCIFIPNWINTMTISCAAVRGKYPVGVALHNGGKYLAYVSINGVKVNLGIFKTQDAAHEAWRSAKMANLFSVKDSIDAIDERLFDGLLSIIESTK